MLPQQAAVSAAMADQMKQTPMYQSYVAVAPRPQDFPVLLDRIGEYMRKPKGWIGDILCGDEEHPWGVVVEEDE